MVACVKLNNEKRVDGSISISIENEADSKHECLPKKPT